MLTLGVGESVALQAQYDGQDLLRVRNTPVTDRMCCL